MTLLCCLSHLFSPWPGLTWKPNAVCVGQPAGPVLTVYGTVGSRCSGVSAVVQPASVGSPGGRACLSIGSSDLGRRPGSPLLAALLGSVPYRANGMFLFEICTHPCSLFGPVIQNLCSPFLKMCLQYLGRAFEPPSSSFTVVPLVFMERGFLCFCTF